MAPADAVLTVMIVAKAKNAIAACKRDQPFVAPTSNLPKESFTARIVVSIRNQNLAVLTLTQSAKSAVWPRVLQFAAK